MKKIILTILLILLLSSLIGLIIIKYKFTPIINSKEFLLEYENIGEENEGYIVVNNKNKYGYYDISKKQLLTKIEYQIPSNMKLNEETALEELIFVDGLAPITIKDQYGLINKKGKTVIEPKYEYIKVYNKDLILVYKDSKYYFINSKDQKLNDSKFEIITEINNNIFAVYDGINYGVINNNFEYLIELKYEQINTTKNEEDIIIIATIQNEKEYYLTKDNKIIKLNIPSNLTLITIFNEKIYFEDNEGFYQIYDILSQKLTKFTKKYEGIGFFNDGIIQVINEEMKVGFINELEEIIIPFEYDYNQTSDFTKYRYATAEKNGLVGVINKKNETIIPFKYKEIYIISENYFLITDKNNQIDIIDINNKNTTNNKYSNISLTTEDKYLLTEIKKDNKTLFGIINVEGKEIIEPNYINIKITNNYLELKTANNKYKLIRKESLQ